MCVLVKENPLLQKKKKEGTVENLNGTSSPPILVSGGVQREEEPPRPLLWIQNPLQEPGFPRWMERMCSVRRKERMGKPSLQSLSLC